MFSMHMHPVSLGHRSGDQASIVSLPNETLSYIFESLTPSTLASVACLSHRFNAVAERVLYAAPSLRDVLTTASPLPSRTSRYCQSLLRRLYLVESIKSFTVRWTTDPNYPPSHYHLAPALADLSSALQILGYLEILDLHLGPANTFDSPQSPHAIERVLYGRSFANLLTCSLGADSVKGGPTYTSIFDDFLTSCSSIRSLRLSDHRSYIHLPPTALRELSAFRGSTHTAASLLPGRPVQSLYLIGQDSDLSRENLYRAIQSSVPIRHLDVSAISIRPVMLKNIAEFLPTLHTLRLRLTLRHTLHYAMSGIRLLTGLSAVLVCFPELESLDLSPTTTTSPTYTSTSQASVEEELVLCKEWRRACSSLRTIIFPSHRKWIMENCDNWTPSPLFISS